MISIEKFIEQYWFFILFIFIVLIAAYVGLFATVEAKETKFPGGLFFYKDLQVSTKNLGPVFRKINDDIAAF